MTVQSQINKILSAPLISMLMFTATTFAAFGDIDAAFGNNGQLNLGNGFIVTAVARQTDGKLIVAGVVVQNNGTPNLRYKLVIKRFNESGSIDTTYGFSGTAATYYEHGNPRAISLQTDGKLLVVSGSGTVQAGNSYVWRFNVNGIYDISFGTNGRATTLDGADRVGSFKSNPYTTSESILVSNSTRIRKLNSNGTTSTGFGENGELAGVGTRFVTKNGTGTINNSSIIVASFFETTTLILRAFDSNGEPIPSFGSGGLTFSFYPIGSLGASIESLTRTPQGKLLVIGSSCSTCSWPDSYIGIHSSNGVLETNLVPIVQNGAKAAAANPDGSILYYGYYGSTRRYSPILAMTDEAANVPCTSIIAIPDSKFICGTSTSVSRRFQN